MSSRSDVVFLTGATGLVGRYLLRGLLERNADVAVLVRSNPRAEAWIRIEEALAEFEKYNLLSRPRVIEGSLHSKSIVANESDDQWLHSKSVTVIHCAASIRFQADSKSGEPYATNAVGTENLVRFLKHLDVREFHHISTAYVGARGSSPIRECRVTDEELAGNDYERSKIQAEEIVCSQLSGIPIAIHRPSIVIGDSQTGFSSTFHGYYAPLQIGAQLAQSFGYSQGLGAWFRQKLGLNDEDSKNLVPVDWLAESILLACEQRSASKNTKILHWTHPSPASALLMQDTITSAIEDHFPNKQPVSSESSELVEAAFQENLKVYESYFRGDPEFSTANSMQFQKQIPCPQIDQELLDRICNFALATKFGWKNKTNLEFSALKSARRLTDFLLQYECSSQTASKNDFSLSLLGNAAPERLHFFKDGAKWCLSHNSRNSELQAELVISLRSLTNCVTGNASLCELISTGEAVLHNGSQQTQKKIHEWTEDLKLRICNHPIFQPVNSAR